MVDIEKVISDLQEQIDWIRDNEFHKFPGWGHTVLAMKDAIALLKEQKALLHEYEKLSQVCFKIEKYLRIADLSILIDRIEEGKVEVFQNDGRPDAMETTIKIRRL